MKRIFSFFLFRTSPEGSTRGKRAGFWVWQFAWVVLGSAGLAFVSLLLAVGPYPLEYMDGYWECPLILLLNMLPAVSLGLLLYVLTCRPVLGYLFSALVILGLSVGNYFKLMFRDDPLLAADFTTLREAANMAGKYRLFLSNKLGACLAAAAAGLVFLLFFVRGRLPRRSRMTLAAALTAAAGCVLSWALCTDPALYGQTAYYEAIEHRWSSTEQYIARGFLYPFLYSTNNTAEQAPAGYREADAAALLDAYEDADIPEDRKVNVVCIMLEAYNDFTKFGVPELTHDVYAVWHRLEEEGYSGNLVTNIFAGGTVDTERSFLTGLSSLPGFQSQTNSYVWYFQDQGYRTGGLHPSRQWFYNRVNINRHLGFQRYLYIDNYFNAFTNEDAAADCVFFPELIREYEWNKERGGPYFNFSVTYQGHGPYDDASCYWGERGEFVVDDGTYTDEQQNILDNYFGSIEDTNRYLGDLTDYFREDDAPVVLVLFGDHNPWMGDGNSVYHAMGIDFDLNTQEGFLNYYSTRYLIWANDAAKEALGGSFRGEGPDISPCFLMNEVFRLCGWEGPAYMQALEPVLERVPVQSSATGSFMADGVLTGTLSPEDQALVDGYRALQYYYRHHFRYSSLEEME